MLIELANPLQVVVIHILTRKYFMLIFLKKVLRNYNFIETYETKGNLPLPSRLVIFRDQLWQPKRCPFFTGNAILVTQFR